MSQYREGELGKHATKYNGLFSEKDWKCTFCNNINWAKRDACNQCNNPKPGSNLAAGRREGAGGGFMERQDDDDTIRRRRQQRYDDGDEWDEFGRRIKKPTSATTSNKSTDAPRRQEEQQQHIDDDDDDDDDGETIMTKNAGNQAKATIVSDQGHRQDDDVRGRHPDLLHDRQGHLLLGVDGRDPPANHHLGIAKTITVGTTGAIIVRALDHPQEETVSIILAARPLLYDSGFFPLGGDDSDDSILM